MKKLPFLFTIIALFSIFVFASPPLHKAYAANVIVGVSGPTSVVSGQTFSISLYVNTQGSQASTVQGGFSTSGPISLGSSPTYNSSLCSFSGPVPGASNTYYCGTTGNGFNSSGDAFVTLQATATGSGTINISVSNAAAAYNSTQYTVGTTGLTVDVQGTGGSTSTPTPTQAQTSTPTPTSKTNSSTPTPTSTKTKNSVTPVNAGTPNSFNGKPTTKPTVTSATQPSLVVVDQPPYKTVTVTNSAGQVIQEQIIVTPSTQSLQTLVQGYFNNTVAALLFILPILVLLIMVGFMSLRMYQMSRRRQREIELLFEHEIGELAALESKMDLINEKGDKGKLEFRQEFERTKDQILKEIRPEYIGANDKKAQAENQKQEEKKE